MATVKKIVLLGHFGVGKTSLVRRYVESAFSEDYLVTVGVHVKKKDVMVEDEPVTLIIWDIEGNNSIEKARNSYLLGTHGFIYVFDVKRQETYANLQDEMQFLEDNYSQTPVRLVGNKSDLFTDEFNASFFKEDIYKDCYFSSAKTGDNVENLFLDIAKSTL